MQADTRYWTRAPAIERAVSDLTWTNSTRKLSELVPWRDNPRQIREADAARLAESLDQFGQIHAIAVGPGNEVYDGHQRQNVWAACDRYGPDYEVDVRVSSRPLSEAEREKLVVYLHSGATGSWDWDRLSSWDTPTLKGWGLDEGQLRGWNDDAANLREMLEADAEPSDEDREADARKTLAERFIVPPFSVLDARQGYWQERKRAWIALGIDSELGRAGALTWGDAPGGEGTGEYSDRDYTDGAKRKRGNMGSTPPHGPTVTQNADGSLCYRKATRKKWTEKVSPGGSPRQAADYHGQRDDGRGRTLGAIAPNEAGANGILTSPGKYADNGLLGFSQQARSHYGAKDFGTEGNASEQTGTSIFDPVLCECAYTWWTGKGFRVLDPFAGGSVRGIVAGYLGREYTGIELREEQVAANAPQWEAIRSREGADESVQVSVSGKWARHKFACSIDYIKRVCHGSCCEGSDRILISLLPEEQRRHLTAGFAVEDGLLQADPATGKCPHKLSSGLCGVHGTEMKPFGCIASPFTLNSNDTLIIRNRYSRMRCHGSGEPAYETFRVSLDLIFGEQEAERICEQARFGVDRIPAAMPRKAYDSLHYLDNLKHGSGTEKACPHWLHGDSANVRELVTEPVDFVFSCPPYYNLEVYSDLEGELSAAPTYKEFIEGYRHIIAECVALLREDRFACFVVGDMRDKKGLYRNFVSDTIAAFQDAGMTLYNEAILVTAVGSLPIRVSGQFPVGRKLGKTHQNVLVFVKGDWRKAAAACGPVEVTELTNGTPELMG